MIVAVVVGAFVGVKLAVAGGGTADVGAGLVARPAQAVKTMAAMVKGKISL